MKHTTSFAQKKFSRWWISFNYDVSKFEICTVSFVKFDLLILPLLFSIPGHSPLATSIKCPSQSPLQIHYKTDFFKYLLRWSSGKISDVCLHLNCPNPFLSKHSPKLFWFTTVLKIMMLNGRKRCFYTLK